MRPSKQPSPSSTGVTADPPSRARRRGISLRWLLVSIVVGSIVPLLAINLLLQYEAFKDNIAATGKSTLVLAHNMSRAVARELDGCIRGLQVMAATPMLRGGELDLAVVRQRADALAAQFAGSNVTVLLPDGRELLNTRVAPDEPGHLSADRETAMQVFETGQPAVADLYRTGENGRLVVAVDVPVKREDGTVAYVLSMHPGLQIFDNVIRQGGVPSDWIVVVFDRDGRIIARRPNPEQFVGQPAALTPKERQVAELEGFFEDGRSLEGIRVMRVFSRTPPYDWTVGIGVPRTALVAPARAEAFRTILASLALLVLSIACALSAAARIRGPIAALRRFATTRESAPALALATTGLCDVDDVARALHTAETDRRRIEAQEQATRGALRKSEESFRYLFDRGPLPQFVYDPESLRILAVNQAAINIYGYAREEFLAKTLPDLLPPEERETVAPAIRSAAPHQHSTDWQHRYKDGRLIDIEIFSHALVFDDKPARLMVVLDVTARKTAESQLLQAQKMEAIGQLTGGMAHDFNNLLGVILGNLGLLQEDGIDGIEFDEFVGAATEAARRGADLTRSLLAFARRQPLRPRRIDPNQLVSQMTTLLRRTLGERIEIELELAPDAWPITVDSAQLEAALLNLATNARDAMPKGGRLSIATGNRWLDAEYAERQRDLAPGDYVMLQVSDTGSGMSPEVIDKIFEPFFTTKPRGQGTGLGLSMVFGFIKQSGGHVNVYSEVGVGTTFRLYIPRAADAVDTSTAAAAETPPRGNGERVLVVEDDAALRRVVVRQLHQTGYTTIEADNAAAALALLERGEPCDVLFSDVVMAGKVDGYDLARIVAEHWPDIRILMTSGFPDAQTADDAAMANVWLLSKPYLRSDLARMLHRVLTEKVGAASPQ